MNVSEIAGAAVGFNAGMRSGEARRREAADAQRHREVIAAITGKTVKQIEHDEYFRELHKRYEQRRQRKAVKRLNRRKWNAFKRAPLPLKIYCLAVYALPTVIVLGLVLFFVWLEHY